MSTTIRNIDETAYRELKARAAQSGKTIGQVLNEAIRAYLAGPQERPKGASLRRLQPVEYPDGNERLSTEIDAIVYGARGAMSCVFMGVGLAVAVGVGDALLQATPIWPV